MALRFIVVRESKCSLSLFRNAHLVCCSMLRGVFVHCTSLQHVYVQVRSAKPSAIGAGPSRKNTQTVAQKIFE